MLCLIRKTTANPDGVFESGDTELDTDKLTVGSAPDQSIQLLSGAVHPEHLVITYQESGDLLVFECLKGTLDAAGKQLNTCKLKVGDFVQVAGNKIARIEPPLGLDVAIQVIQGTAMAGAARENAFEVPQEIARGRTILWSALLFLVVIVTGVMLPLLTSVSDGPSAPLQALPVPSDNFWSSGPLLNAHQARDIGNDCGACHVKAFQMVQDSACEGCHTDMGDHSLDEEWSQHPVLGKRCASCHKEHNEPVQISRNDDAFCVQCHGHDKLVGDERLNLQSVEHFSAQGHPEFRVALLSTVGTSGESGWQVERARLAETPLVEQSNLKFPHDLHLDGDRVQTLGTGNALGCGDCHQLSGDDEHFVPITMETTCKGCHSLSFASPDPTRELPHAAPEIVINAMQEYFVKFYASPENRDPEPPPWRRRLPGKKYQYTPCNASAYECGMQQAKLEADRQFSVTGCVTCHEVADGTEGGNAAAWSVAPVKLADDWFVYGRFNHAVHRPAVGLGEVEGCLSCHDARASASSADILLPDKKLCLDCHSSAQAASVTLSCVNCHQFHISDIVTASDAGR